jgi:hypothetical protein
MERMYAARRIVVSSSPGVWNLFSPRVFLEAKEKIKQIIWSGALAVPRKNFPSRQQPKSLSVDHKPTCLFFLIGKLMSAVVSSKIHTYEPMKSEASSREFWFSLGSSLATSLLNCSWTTSLDSTPECLSFHFSSCAVGKPFTGAKCECQIEEFFQCWHCTGHRHTIMHQGTTDQAYWPPIMNKDITLSHQVCPLHQFDIVVV